MTALKMFLVTILLMTSLNTIGDCHGLFRRLLQVSSTSSVERDSSVNIQIPPPQPPVDSGIIEGETDESRRRWHLRQLDRLLPKSTMEPLQRIGDEKEEEEKGETSSVSPRKQVSTPPSNFEPSFANHKRFPFFKPSVIGPRMLQTPPRFAIPPLASDFIQEGDSGMTRTRYGSHRSIDNFPTLLNQPGQEYLDAINRRTVWPGFTTTTTTTQRSVTNIPITVSSTSSTLATTSKPVLTATTDDYKWLSVATQPSSTREFEEPSPPLVLTTKYNDTTIGTAFSLSEDLTDAHLSMEMFTSPKGNNVTFNSTTEGMSTTVPTIATMATTTTTMATTTVTTNSPTIIPVTVISTSTVPVTQLATSEVTTVKPETLTTQSTSNITIKPEETLIKTEFTVNTTVVEVVNVQQLESVVQEPNSTNITANSLSAEFNEKMETSTTFFNSTNLTTTTPTPSTTLLQTTPAPISTTVTTTTNNKETKPRLLSAAITVPPLLKRRIPSFRSNPLRQRPPNPPKVMTTTLSIIAIEEDEEDYYVPTLPPMEPPSTKPQHVITVPPIDDSFDVAVFSDDESSLVEDEEDGDSLEPTSSEDEKRLIPEGAKDAIVISIVIGGCAVVFFAGVMIICMLRNRRTVYRAPDSSASSSNSNSPFSTKLG